MARKIQRDDNPADINWQLLLSFGFLGLSALGAYMSWRSMMRAEQDAPPRRILDPGESVLLLGDSIGVGLEKPLRHLLETYGSHFDSMVEVGTSAGSWAPRVSDADGGYDVILLSLGSNDIASGVVVPSESQKLDELLSHLRSRGAKTYWIVPPSFREEGLTNVQQDFTDLMGQKGLFPLPIQGPQQDVSKDPMRLHLTPQGYQAYAAQIFDALTR